MKSNQPVFTREAACQDCYRCLRECPIKAITVHDGMAAVDPNRCIFCGTCLGVCPVKAKTVRDDIPLAKLLLKKKQKVVVSLAPSHAVAFPQGVGHLAAGLRHIGFFAVEETAIGAYMISRELADFFAQKQATGGIPKLIISTACPAIVTLVQKHYPHLVPFLAPVCSPVAAHSKLIKSKYGPDTGIVFFGPCPAKKTEVGAEGCELDAVLSFNDLSLWFEHEQIDLSAQDPDGGDSVEPIPAAHGTLYPMEGGMVESIRSFGPHPSVEMQAYSGLESVIAVLDDLEPQSLTSPVFLDLLSCKGGCINGACMPETGRLLAKRAEVRKYADTINRLGAAPERLNVSMSFGVTPFEDQSFSSDQMRVALERIGKLTADDELNCSGCGYSSCRNFVRAMLQHRAEPDMCVSYMRSLALKKANALMLSMPAGAVIVNRELQLVECNSRFVQIVVPELVPHFAETGSLNKLSVATIPPLDKFFSAVLINNQSIPEKQIHLNNRIVSLSVFPIEPGRLAGGIVQDITQPTVHKEQIISKAREVSRRHLTMVQQIASLLGENAADSETLLNEIIACFTVEKE